MNREGAHDAKKRKKKMQFFLRAKSVFAV